MTKNPKPNLPKDDSLLKPIDSPAPAATAVAAAPADATAKTLQNLKALLTGLSPEEREQIARLGVNVPAGDIEAAVRGEYKWGLRCTQCNEMALYFVGDKFLDVATNIEYDKPQSWMPTNQISWTQHLPSDEIDRAVPKCQHCGHAVEMQGNNCFRFDRRLTELTNWRASRDASFSRRAINELRRNVAAMGDAVVMPDGRLVQLSDSVRREVVTELASQVLARTRPEALKDIAETERMLGGNLLAALAQEQKGG